MIFGASSIIQKFRISCVIYRSWFVERWFTKKQRNYFAKLRRLWEINYKVAIDAKPINTRKQRRPKEILSEIIKKNYSYHCKINLQQKRYFISVSECVILMNSWNEAICFWLNFMQYQNLGQESKNFSSFN